MKFLRNIFFVLLLSALGACAGQGAAKQEAQVVGASPSEVAVTLYTGLTSGDVKAVIENIYFTNSIDSNVFRDYFEMAVASSDYKKRTEGFKAQYKAVSETIDGEDAVVALEGMGPLGNFLKINVKLHLIDGHWKVDGHHGVYHTEFPKDKK